MHEQPIDDVLAPLPRHRFSGRERFYPIVARWRLVHRGDRRRLSFRSPERIRMHSTRRLGENGADVSNVRCPPHR